MQTAGFILAGGRSARMGRDKALLPWRGMRRPSRGIKSHGTLVETIAEHVRDAAGNVALVAKAEAYAGMGFDTVHDLRPGLGPLSGIEAALASGRGELNLILACDLPLIETDWLKRLIETAIRNDARCVVASDSQGRVHPLCGVYRTDCLPVVKDALDQGRLKLMDTVQELRAERMPIVSPIWNVNTPEEWQACQEVANGRR